MYALIGRLLYAAPDADLMAQICAIGGPEGEAGAGTLLTQTWQALQGACRAATPDAIRHEHETLFVGVGKAVVTPYTSHYVTENAPDRHLVALRDQLERWGLTRAAGAFEVEDHISGLCDVMRFLIDEQHPLSDQRMFFERFVYPGALPLFDAVNSAASETGFYKSVVAFASAFLQVERAAFDMEGETPALVF